MGLLGGDTMKVAKEIQNSRTSQNLGINVLYLIATLTEEEKQATKKDQQKRSYQIRPRGLISKRYEI